MPEIYLAGCVINDDQGRILLLHRNTPKRKQWEIPGGKLDPGEDARTTAARELREEMGVEVNVGKLLGEEKFDEDGYTMVYAWFHATITSGVPAVREHHVHDRCAYLPVARLEQMYEELSPNTKNFVNEYREGRIEL